MELVLAQSVRVFGNIYAAAIIPKGDCINNYSLQQIIDIETWCNSLPRKILAYHTPDEIFERELDQIYQAA